MTSLQKIETNRLNALKSTGPKTKKGKTAVAGNAIAHGALSTIAIIPGLERVEEWNGHLSGILSSLLPVGALEKMLAERIALLLWRMNRVARYEREAIAISQEQAADDLADKRRFMLRGGLGHPNNAAEDYKYARYELRLLERFLASANDAPISGLDAATILCAMASPAKIDLEETSFQGIPDDIPLEKHELWTVGLVRSCIDAIAAEAKEPPDSIINNALSATRLNVWKTKHEAESVAKEINVMRRQRILPDVNSLERVQRYEAHLSRQLFQTLHELQRIQAAREGLPVLLPTAVDVTVSELGGRSELCENGFVSQNSR